MHRLMFSAWLSNHLSPQPKPMMLPFMEDRQRRRWQRGLGDADRRRRRMAPVVRPPSPESPVGQRSGAHRPAEEESDSSSSSHGTPSDEQRRGRPSAAPSSPSPQARRSQPRYHRLRHRKQREGFSPVAERPSSQKRAHSRQQPPQRDHGRDSRRTAGAPPSGRKRPREESRSHSPDPRPLNPPPPPPPPPAGWDDHDEGHHPDASSSAQTAGASDRTSWRRRESTRGYWEKRHTPDGKWAQRRRRRAVQHQERVAAGQAPDPGRPTGAQLAGQGCEGCGGRQHFPFSCLRRLCGDCCRAHPERPCKDHRR